MMFSVRFAKMGGATSYRNNDMELESEKEEKLAAKKSHRFYAAKA